MRGLTGKRLVEILENSLASISFDLDVKRHIQSIKDLLYKKDDLDVSAFSSLEDFKKEDDLWRFLHDARNDELAAKLITIETDIRTTIGRGREGTHRKSKKIAKITVIAIGIVVLVTGAAEILNAFEIFNPMWTRIIAAAVSVIALFVEVFFGGREILSDAKNNDSPERVPNEPKAPECPDVPTNGGVSSQSVIQGVGTGNIEDELSDAQPKAESAERNVALRGRWLIREYIRPPYIVVAVLSLILIILWCCSFRLDFHKFSAGVYIGIFVLSILSYFSIFFTRQFRETFNKRRTRFHLFNAPIIAIAICWGILHDIIWRRWPPPGGGSDVGFDSQFFIIEGSILLVPLFLMGSVVFMIHKRYKRYKKDRACGNQKHTILLFSISLLFITVSTVFGIFTFYRHSRMGDEFVYEQYTYVVQEDGSLMFLMKDYEVETLIIPSEVKGVPVTKVKADFGYDGSAKLKSIVIPDSVITIESNILAKCAHLENIEASFKDRGITYFFSMQKPDNMSGWAEIKLRWGGSIDNRMSIYYVPSSLRSVTATGNSISSGAFSGFANLAEIHLADGVTKIGERAFENCTSLTKITISDGVTEIGTHAFENCTSLTEITIPDSVRSIRDGSFTNCGAVKKINGAEYVDHWLVSCDTSVLDISLQKGTIGIADCVFESHTVIRSVTLCDSLQYIGSRAFYSTSLTSIEFPASLISIGNFAFAYTSLKNITFPASLTTIGSSAFYSTSLTSIELPASLVYIGSQAFSETSLTSAVFADTEEWYYMEDSTSHYIPESELRDAQQAAKLLGYSSESYGYAEYEWERHQ